MIAFLAILLLLATFSTRLASRLGVPGLVIFLGLGMLFGSDGLNLIYFDDPVIAQHLAIGFLIIILFEGGFNTKKNLLAMALKPSFTLSTLGIVITALATGMLAYILLGIDWQYALLIGAIIASTDAAAVFSMFRSRNIDPKVAATLEIESASNDPMAIILTITLIDFIQGTLSSPLVFIGSLIWQILFAVFIGYVIGKLSPIIFSRAKLDRGFYYVLALGLCFLSFGIADALNANGFLAVFISGYFLGNANFVYKQGIASFMEGTSTFSHVILFLMLGLLVFPTEVLGFWREGVIISLILIFIARPLAVAISTALFKFNFTERVFLVWGGVKGAVPIVLATYPAVAGIENAGFFLNVVFFVVLISALVQGATVDFAAKKLNLVRGKKKTPSHSLELISLAETQHELIEYVVKENTKFIGKKLKDISLPSSTLIVTILRKDDIITPRGSTKIMPHDLLFILVKYSHKEELLAELDELVDPDPDPTPEEPPPNPIP